MVEVTIKLTYDDDFKKIKKHELKLVTDKLCDISQAYVVRVIGIKNRGFNGNTIERTKTDVT